jgi:hypothetical protein
MQRLSTEEVLTAVSRRLDDRRRLPLPLVA